MRRRTPRIPLPPAHDGCTNGACRGLAWLDDGEGALRCLDCDLILPITTGSSPAPTVSKRPASPFGSTTPFAPVAFGSITPERHETARAWYGRMLAGQEADPRGQGGGGGGGADSHPRGVERDC